MKRSATGFGNLKKQGHPTFRTVPLRLSGRSGRHFFTRCLCLADNVCRLQVTQQQLESVQEHTAPVTISAGTLPGPTPELHEEFGCNARTPL